MNHLSDRLKQFTTGTSGKALSKTLSKNTRRPNLVMLAAVTAIAGSLGFSTFGVSSSVVSAQAATPTSRADCANWRSFGFSSRAACITFVQNNTGNGYGGNGGGNGNVGGIGRVISNIINAITRIIRAIFGSFF